MVSELEMRVMTPKLGRAKVKKNGFTYLGLLIMIAIIAIAATATLRIGAVVQRRSAEQQLLSIGAEFRYALISYASATPAGQLNAPTTLEDLLKDPRYPNVRRHLRKLYVDPITGSTDWGIVHGLDGKSIVGIYSRSDAAPIKISGFEQAFLSFEGKTHYSDWIFANGLFNGSNVVTPAAAQRAQPNVVNPPPNNAQSPLSPN